mgnify:CR=1 FL=1
MKDTRAARQLGRSLSCIFFRMGTDEIRQELYIIVITDGFTDSEGRVISRNQQINPESDSAFVPAFFLCAFLGWLGAHSFYTGKYLTAVLMILTFGGLGIWVLIDSVMLVTGGFRDGEGKLV